ncbi:hypothetical protein BDN72DRAFT_907339 [Pluteus cervinus]|uniref:Uncharacterized protein n=1 Tax=Pluteus cervinus TaxID=181527 RepID=A0ACD2ZXD4_9AGAR|nr:hypothetical protein BDN72DRAFT_907339 [Pluteus cervinus]
MPQGTYHNIRYLRIKHIVPFNNYVPVDYSDEESSDEEGDEEESDMGNEQVGEEPADNENPGPWTHSSWLDMFKGFPNLRVFHINTPLLLTRNGDELRFIKSWMEPVNGIRRVYIYHGYDNQANFSTLPNTRGEALLFVRERWRTFYQGEITRYDKWERLVIDLCGLQRGEDGVIHRILRYDEDPFSRDSNTGLLLLEHGPECFDDDPAWMTG